MSFKKSRKIVWKIETWEHRYKIITKMRYVRLAHRLSDKKKKFPIWLTGLVTKNFPIKVLLQADLLIASCGLTGFVIIVLTGGD